MKNQEKLKVLAEQIETLMKNVTEGANDPTLASSLKEVVHVLSNVVQEMQTLKQDVHENKNSLEVLSERVNDIEEYIDENDNLIDDEILGKVECPNCSHEIEIGKEFLTAEEPKIVCPSCKQEIEVLTSGGCGEGCGCHDKGGCDCHDAEEEDFGGGCGSGCGCGH